ncbi:MAG: c-type cytochrome [Myxococcaceae bacterium]|nr:c-type cytochrome [Myxococcaceae bacterium]
MRIALPLLALTALACHRPDGATPVISGKEMFRACTACHGEHGEGNATIQAPAIAGLPDWYVESQITKFRTGVRGAHPDDYEGLRMRPMSRQMMNPAEIHSVVHYVSHDLKPVKGAKLVKDGDATAGAASYATCIACHGVKGEGNLATKAPPLAQLPDWYMLAQLQKFKKGIRGANPNDVTGNTMRAMSAVLVDEQAMKNVIAHIGTLNP